MKVVHEGLGIRHGVITTIHDLTPRSCFGHTRFDFADVIPVAEGRGIYPELWLDEVDPVTFLRALPASR